ncbi:MAG: hypothetical protein BZY87_03070 [SAR202 cluster bacterium Io17-Chloro-G6]|nr:MAG: hypothetical protein BZY87_03070 [SAR202 cluster bacterium Io17-Chloro-G6]
MCRLAELTPSVGAAVVASGMAVGGAVVDPGIAVGSGVFVAEGADVAVAEEPQATMNTKSIKISTTGFFRMGSSILNLTVFGTPSIYLAAIRERRGLLPVNNSTEYSKSYRCAADNFPLPVDLETSQLSA